MPTRSRSAKTAAALLVLQADAAGIDIGATEIYGAEPGERDPQPIRAFSTFTEDLLALAAWLQASQIRTVAMEAGAPRAAVSMGSRSFIFWRRAAWKSVW